MSKIKFILVSLAGLFIGACSGEHNPHEFSAPALTSEKPSLSFEGVTAAVLKSKCLDCHSPVLTKGGVDLTDYESLLLQPGALIIPGDPDGSDLIQIIESGEMPEDDRPRVSAEELEFLKAWIRAGAPFDAKSSMISSPPSEELPTANSEEAVPSPFEPVSPGGDLSSQLDSAPIVTYERVYAEIFEPKCSRCHSGPFAEGFVDVSDLESLKNNFFVRNLIVPGNPQASLLYRVVDSGRMPQRAPKLSQSELELIRLWIFEAEELKTPLDVL